MIVGRMTEGMMIRMVVSIVKLIARLKVWMVLKMVVMVVMVWNS